MAGEVELLDDGKLQEQLLTLVLRGGKTDHLPGDHDDYANAACGALVLVDSPALYDGFIRYYAEIARGGGGGAVDVADYVRMRAPSHVGSASGMDGRQYRPDARGVYLIHPDDVRPFERGGFVLLQNAEVS